MKLISPSDPDFAKYIPEFLAKLASPREYTPEELKEIYAAMKEEFPPAAAEKAFQDAMANGVPMEDLLDELRKAQNELTDRQS